MGCCRRFTRRCPRSPGATLKCLFVIPYPVFGGPHNQAIRLHSALLRRGWETIVAIPADDGEGNAGERLGAAGIEVLRLRFDRLRAGFRPRSHLKYVAGFIPTISGIRRAIRQHEIDLVLLGGLVNPHAAFAGNAEGKAVVWQVLDSRTPAVLQRPLLGIGERLADGFMFTGQALVDEHMRGGKPRIPITLYCPPVDTSLFFPSMERRIATRKALSISPEGPLVGMVANLNPQKGIDYFIEAAALIRRACPGCRFMLVGARYESHASYNKEIQRRVARVGLSSDTLIFVGDRPDVEQYYPAMDISTMTSVPRSEGIPTTVLEAMACGVPVVATNVGAVQEVVEDGRTGLIVQAQDARAIADAVIGLLGDPTRREVLGATSRERVLMRYSIERSAEAHSAAFAAAVDRRKTRRHV